MGEKIRHNLFFLPFVSRRGFTLIELLVVIAIIGLLSMIVFASLSTARQKARDAKRAMEIRNIATALLLYHGTNGNFPTAAGATSIPGTVKTALQPWMSAVPDDVPAGRTGGGYQWYTNSGAGEDQNFCIFVLDEADSNYIVSSVYGTGKRNVAPNSLANCVRNI